MYCPPVKTNGVGYHHDLVWFGSSIVAVEEASSLPLLLQAPEVAGCTDNLAIESLVSEYEVAV
jgi:hypothetical protein